MHRTRSEISKLWPVPRKGNKYVAVAKHNQNSGIPLLVVLRDILKLGKKKKEAKKIIAEEKIKINGKVVKEDKFPLIMLDILSIEEKKYKVIVKNKKLALEETRDNSKIAKIIGKTILPGGKVQINLNDGRNFVSQEKAKVGDSVVISLKDGKVEKIIPMKEGSGVLVIGGSHIGEEGKIEKIYKEKGEAEVKIGKDKINLKLETLTAL